MADSNHERLRPPEPKHDAVNEWQSLENAMVSLTMRTSQTVAAPVPKLAQGAIV